MTISSKKFPFGMSGMRAAVLTCLDAAHLRVPIRTVIFGLLRLLHTLHIPAIRRSVRLLELRKREDTRSRPIKVYFLSINQAQWVYQNIYEAMANDPDFAPFVFVCNEWISLGNDANQKLLRFFSDKGMNVVQQLDYSDLPDVIFFPNLDARVFGNAIDITKVYDKILCCTLFYSMGIDNDGSYYIYQPNFVYAWRQYVPCEFYKQLASEKGACRGENVVCSGSPKSDSIHTSSGSCPIWKQDRTRCKRIIYAPHWSILTHGRMSNFDRYYNLFYEYLRFHPEVEIVLKPHPMLKPRLTDPVIQARLKENNPEFTDVNCLPTKEEYDAFIEKWCALPNASYMDAGDYNDLFASSDAMILDSVSFMAEYMVTDKPMCFCIREPLENLQKRLGFNEFGKDLNSAMSIASTWDEIVQFIEEIVIKGDDPLQETRKRAIEKHLSVNRGHVGEFIANDIKSALR